MAAETPARRKLLGQLGVDQISLIIANTSVTAKLFTVIPRVCMFILASVLAGSLWLQAQAGAQAAPGGAPADLPRNARQDSVAVAPTMSAAEAASRFGLTLTTSPETLTVGQHFSVTVRVHVPIALQSTIQFPTDVDTSTQIVTTSVGIGLRHDSIAGGFVNATQTYQLAAWDIGVVPIGLADLVIGQTHIPLAARTVFVRSVLPKDSIARLRAQPKEPRGLFRLIVTVRRAVRQAVKDHRVIFALIALMVGLLALLWVRSRRRRQAAALIDWAKWAKQEFQRIEAMHLLEKGEPERHAILMTNVLRESLIHQFPAVRASATTRELAAVLQRESLIPAERTLQLFERVDLFKFAGLNSEVVEARTIGLEDEAIVDEIEVRRQAELAAREAARQAAAAAKKTA